MTFTPRPFRMLTRAALSGQGYDDEARASASFENIS